MQNSVVVDERLEHQKLRAAYDAFRAMNILLILLFFVLNFLTDDFLIPILVFAVWFIGNLVYEEKAREYEGMRLATIFARPELRKRYLLRHILTAPLWGAIMFSLHYWGFNGEFRSALTQGIVFAMAMPLLWWFLEQHEAKAALERERAANVDSE